MNTLKLGYLALSKASWMTPRIEKIAAETYKSLHSLSAEIVFHGVTTTEAEAIERADEFARAGVDAVIMHFVTFPVGAIIPAVAQRLTGPFLLVSNPEKPGAGKVLEQNSFCGANMAAHGLNRLRKPYSFTLTPPAETAAALAKPLAAVQAIRALSRLRIGCVGGRVPGFYTSNFDELQLRRDLGVAVEVMDLLEAVKTAEQLPANELKAAAAVVKRSSCKVNGLSPDDLDRAARLYGAFRKLAAKYRLDSFAVRCWPECSDFFGIAPCAVLGMLSATGLTTSCEGDVTGAVTMKLLEFLAGGGTAFFVDLISTEAAGNTGVVWHCGAAPSSLCRDFDETQLRLHMRVDGGDKKGITNDFSLKAGRITLAKLDTDVDGRMRMLIAPGEAVDTEPFLRGNPLTIRFDGSVTELVATVMKRGFEHHYAVIHADVKDALIQFCEWKQIEPVVIA